MTAPKILGRLPDDDTAGARSTTHPVGVASVPYQAGAIGETKVEVFRSDDDEDRGGVVLRITTRDDASSFVAHAVQLGDGIEVHVAGTAEADAFLRALRAALASV